MLRETELAGRTLDTFVVGGQVVVWTAPDFFWQVDARAGEVGSPVQRALPDDAQLHVSRDNVWVTDRSTRTISPVPLSEFFLSSGESQPTEVSTAWSRSGIGMSGSFLSSGGSIVLADATLAYTASGFEEQPTITALAADTGDVVWEVESTQTDPSFVQAVIGEILITSERYGTVAARRASDGSELWTFEFPREYHQVAVTRVGDRLAVGISPTTEGDVRPPLIAMLDLEDGQEIWRQTLEEGTELQWNPMAVSDGILFIASTLSHPGSAPGNAVHALDAESGDVIWQESIGGGQGFNEYPLLVDDSRVLVTHSGGLTALSKATGDVLWARQATSGLNLTRSSRILAATWEGDFVTLDPETGSTLTSIASIPGWILEARSVDDTVIVTTSESISIYDATTSELTWRWLAPAPIADRPAFTDNFAIVPLTTRTVVRVDFP
jgi:outer membrane protein assembly factor BamB